MLKKGMYYICSPLWAPTEEMRRQNMLMARHYMKVINEAFLCRTVAPHAYLPELLDDSIQRERSLGLAFGQVLLGWCDGMIVCGNRISSGMKKEMDRAKERGIPIYYFMENRDGFYIGKYRENWEVTDEMQIQRDKVS